VRTLLHMTAGEFRARYTGELMGERFRQDLVVPHIDKLTILRPLSVRSGVRTTGSMVQERAAA
jgi:hypothetical protein